MPKKINKIKGLPDTSKPIKFKPVPHKFLLRSLRMNEVSDTLTNDNKVIDLKKKMKIQIRYNTHFDGKGGYRWRLLVNGKAILLIDSAIFNCPTFTSNDEVEVDGKLVVKSHISCQATELKVFIEAETENLIAHIK